MDESQLRYEMARGDSIRALLENEYISAAIADLAANYQRKVMADFDKDAWDAANALVAVVNAFNQLVITGDMAAQQLRKK